MYSDRYHVHAAGFETAPERIAPTLRHDDARVAIPASGHAKVAVIADTHSLPHPAALELIERERPAAILHAGDIGELAVLEPFRALAPLYAVRGNIDIHTGPPDSIRITLHRATDTLLTILLMHIAVRGPKLRSDALARARRHGAQVVVCGHSHVPLVGSTDGVAVFNPGSIGPRRFQLPITFGVLDIAPDGLGFRHVDCETGERWHPR